jgi:hypothetical protein
MGAVDVTATSTFEITAGIGHTFKEVKVLVPATTVSADTFTFSLARAGATKITGIEGYVATTEGSIVVAEAPTTAVVSGVLTVTVGGSAVTKSRLYVIHMV